MKPLVVAVAAALAGCGLAQPNTSTPQGQCEAEALANPKVGELTTKSISNSVATRTSALEERDRLKARLVRECLARRGLGPPGGVELPNP